MRNEPKSAYDLHMTCRAAAHAVQQAIPTLSLDDKEVDIVHVLHAFPCLVNLQCRNCKIAVQVCLYP